MLLLRRCSVGIENMALPLRPSVSRIVVLGVDTDFCGMKGVDGGDIGIPVTADSTNVGATSAPVISRPGSGGVVFLVFSLRFAPTDKLFLPTAVFVIQSGDALSGRNKEGI